jgi:hypothetical protein
MNKRRLGMKPRVEFDRRETPKYAEYLKQFRAGTAIPVLAEREGCTNREMAERIARAHGVHRFSHEMKRWKRECNIMRRRNGELPPLNNLPSLNDRSESR